MKKLSSILLSLCVIISILITPTTVEATNTSVVDKAVSWIKKIADDNSHGYSQPNRTRGIDYDCSSLVCTAFKQAGVNISPTTTTRGMKKAFENCGFVSINWTRSLGLKKGDILLRTGHTELYIGYDSGIKNYAKIGAHWDYDGKTGDSSGDEISASPYNKNTENWQFVLRCPEPTSVSLNAEVLNLGSGETYQLTVKANPGNAVTKYKWDSSDPNVVTVSQNGNITAKKPGNATIRVKSSNNKIDICKVNVYNLPNKVKLSVSEIKLGVGKTYDLNHSFSSGTFSRNTEYTSNNKKVATVSPSTGLITARKPGTAIIIVKTFNGKTAICKVTVKK